MDTQKLFKNAAAHFHAVTGFRLGPRQAGDGLVQLNLKGTPLEFTTEYKTALRQEGLGVLIHYLKNLTPKGILIADYVPPRIADRLRAEDVPFIDTAGNMYIREEGLVTFVRGIKTQEQIEQRKPRGVAFQPGGLKVIFALLCETELVNRPMREIAEKANVTLGTVGTVVRELIELRFILPTKKNRQRTLLDTERLLREWTMHFAVTLRPRLLLGRFEATDPERTKTENLEIGTTYAGGENGGANLTDYLVAKTTTLYTRETKGKAVAKLHLREKIDGNVELLQAFWGETLQHTDRLAPTLLIYADLLASGDPRNREVATRIYDYQIKNLLD